MKNLLLFCLAMVLATPLFAQGYFFTPVQNKQLPNLDNTRFFRTDKAWISELTDQKAIADYLALAPHENTTSAKNGQIIELPNPNGGATAFQIVRYTMIHPSVQAAMPNLVTAYGIDTEGKGLSLSLSYTEAGISAMVRGGQNGRWMIDPVFAGDNRFHQSFYTKDSPATVERQCLVEDNVLGNIDQEEALEEKVIGDCRLRTFDLAVACTGEYFDYMVTEYGDNTNDRSPNDYTTVLQRIMVSVDRINQIYREEIAVVFTLVNQVEMDTVQLLFNDATQDPYDNANGNQLLSVNTDVINDAIGAASYDVGHVFSTGGGGVATTGVCDDDNKGNGVTGSLAPEMDAFDVDFVAHEIGHQFGAGHTFNSEEGACDDNNRSGNTAFEPGSGSTIMAYANICAPDNVQSSSDPYFNVISLEEISAELQSAEPTSCADFTTGNLEPTIEAGQNYSIPLNTPFVLTAVGADPDGGTLTYAWEQYFNAATTTFNGEPTGGETNVPLFRSRQPTTDPQRYFPTLQSVIDNTTTGDWESLPTAAQTLVFKATVRDGFANGGYGCPQADQMQVTFVNTSAQFGVTSPNGGESFITGSTQTITWNDAGTRTNGINCANVDILLSTDGGLTYPQTLATATPNDGSLSVTMPTTQTSTARIMVRCSDNIFYDISNMDFALEATEFTFDGDLNEVSICSGESEAIFSVDVGSTQGYTGSIDLSITSGLPAGATATFTTTPVVFSAGNGNINSTENIMLTIGNLAGAADGDYTIEATANDGASGKTTQLSLNVGAGTIPLASPTDNAQVLVTNANPVVFNFTTVDGYEGYRLNYVVMIGGGSATGSNGFTYGSNPGVISESFSINFSGSAADGRPVTWTITAIDDDGPEADLISCGRTFTFVTDLPVTWLEFTARVSGKTALLNWSVEQDALNAGFAIERNLAGTNSWLQIGYIQRSGPDGTANYQFTDVEVSAGNTYNYRLRQEDADATISYSDIRTVAFEDAFGLSVVPNPANDFVMLNAGSGTQENLRYSLYDPAGRKVSEGTMNGGQVRINMSQLPAAIYQILVTDGAGYREVARVVKR